jgi:DNA-binding MarR family transcriptional regulator
MAIERHVERELEILTAIEEGVPLTQRALAQRLGVALGLTNLYLKRLAGKGFIKIREFPIKPYAGKRLRYVLTPKGVGEKARLTYEYMGHSLNLFRRTRDNLREAMSHLGDNGMKRIALCGVGEAAELAYLTLKEFGLEPVGVFAGEGGGQFLGLPIRPVSELPTADVDGIVIATFDKPDQHLAALGRMGIPAQKLLTLRRPASSPTNGQSNGGPPADGARAKRS